MPEPLTDADVRHVAELARLTLTDEQVAMYRDQLACVLNHIAQLSELDVTGVEPMAHPTDITNRLAEDEVAEPLAAEEVLRNAPASLESFITVPKVIGDGGAA